VNIHTWTYRYNFYRFPSLWIRPV